MRLFGADFTRGTCVVDIASNASAVELVTVSDCIKMSLVAQHNKMFIVCANNHARLYKALSKLYYLLRNA